MQLLPHNKLCVNILHLVDVDTPPTDGCEVSQYCSNSDAKNVSDVGWVFLSADDDGGEGGAAQLARNLPFGGRGGGTYHSTHITTPPQIR